MVVTQGLGTAVARYEVESRYCGNECNPLLSHMILTYMFLTLQ